LATPVKWTLLLRPRNGETKLVSPEVCSGFCWVDCLRLNPFEKRERPGPRSGPPSPPVCWGAIAYRRRRSVFKHWFRSRRGLCPATVGLDPSVTYVLSDGGWCAGFPRSVGGLRILVLGDTNPQASHCPMLGVDASGCIVGNTIATPDQRTSTKALAMGAEVKE